MKTIQYALDDYQVMSFAIREQESLVRRSDVEVVADRILRQYVSPTRFRRIRLYEQGRLLVDMAINFELRPTFLFSPNKATTLTQKASA